MEDKLSKGDDYKRFKKGSKPEYGNSGPENFVHSPFKISGSAPGTISPVLHCDHLALGRRELVYMLLLNLFVYPVCINVCLFSLPHLVSGAGCGL